jgi:ubiquinol-cytochrome c reductase cytochrome b subunit
MRLPAPIRALFDERLPHGVGWPHVLGSVLLALLGVQALTGVLLALNYSSSTETAWESVRYIQERATFGALVRGIHHWAASAAIVVAALHMVRVFVYAAYRPPRRWTWFVGGLLLLTLLAFGLTGYLLPWDLKAYFGTRVATAIPGSVPLAGPTVMRLIRGGDEVGNLTLTRFYALHVIVLPATLVALVAIHLRLIRRHGITPPWVDGQATPEFGCRFFPYQAWKDSLAVLFVVGVVYLLALGLGAPLGDKADPTNVTYVPRPDWYFLGLQHLLRIFQGKWQILGTFLIPNAALLLLLFLPWIDRNRRRRLSARPAALCLGAGGVAAVVGLTLAGYVSVKRAEAHLAGLARPAAPAPLPATAPAPAGDAVALGRRLYETLRCGTCHEADRQEIVPGLPPDLSYAGSKLRPEWVATYLRDPYPIRWLAENRRPTIRMPHYRLNEGEAVALASYLGSRVDEQRFGKVADSDLFASVDEEQGRRLFGEYQCLGCHVFNGEGNRIGPDLTQVGSRLRPEYVFVFVRNPGALIPGTAMKEIELWDEEAAAITKFLDIQR